MSIDDKALWYGYLNSGDKSTPIVLDYELHTGSDETIYLFNFKRGAILEYRRIIVEKKMKELDEKESALIKELKKSYLAAKESFNLPKIIKNTQSIDKGKNNSEDEDFSEVDTFLDIDDEEFLREED
ncbi:hypothetical protein [Candidatus Nitrosacidococcus tergens]|uniref:Uncharacterized protein n=1 Tax=Candidatus Nitrosacidococcus tergens TaxID=553981 RepID=A0A7G1Q8Q6_9GAMM|nr:hypothetical protein [Candidatus Nitrosacidococcus tergens]CAB1275339.1 conserved protein of unknown function [Candidatus Nitrosacidococcus tergens]